MRRWRSNIYLAAIWLVLGLAGVCSAQRDTLRVAVLPFANLTENAALGPQMASSVRHALTRHHIESVDSVSVAGALRKHRIRSTTELQSDEARDLCNETGSRFLLLGTVDRFMDGDSSAEVALSARLLEGSTGRVMWANSITAADDPRHHVLGLGGRVHSRDLVPRAVHDLLKTLRTERVSGTRVVSSIGSTQSKLPPQTCRKVMLVVFGNETDTRFAGHILTNQLLSALYRAGFEISDPGQVRDMMLRSRQLVQGEITRELLSSAADSLGADFVLTGTVSRYGADRDRDFDDPSVAFEARLIDAHRGALVWAKTYERHGSDSGTIFDLGSVHCLSTLSERMARQLARSIPATRLRVTSELANQK